MAATPTSLYYISAIYDYIHTNSANYINFITIQYFSGPWMDGCETEAEWFLCCWDDSHHEVSGQRGRSWQSVSTIRSNMPVALLSLSSTSLRLTLLLLLLRSIHLSWLVVWWWCQSCVTICSGASRTAAWSSWTSWRSSTCRGWALVVGCY